MNNSVQVELELALDTPTSMTFKEVYAGLTDIWYRVSSDQDGNVELWATPDGFEYLGRLFLKLARTKKVSGYHQHMTLEHRGEPPISEPELTIGVLAERPPAV